ncbi:MAG: alpha/beta hydrolase-fold protein [Paludibacter sp.]|nr:alpha/beta hydrolase-fold protein [Paludibacter sp.]
MTKKLIILLIIYIQAATINVTAGNFLVHDNVQFYSKILQQPIKFAVILPKQYFESNNQYPTIYFLHGLGDSHNAWLENGQLAQHAYRLTKNKTIQPFISIIPQGFTTYYSNFSDGSFSYQDMFVKELVPFVDSVFRTRKDPSQRAVMGYSMGGFGALVLPVRHPDVFGISIPLSASIRTDAQYMSEEQRGWNEQWGRIFGGIDKQGNHRLTDYYKNNSPFYLFKNIKLEELKRIKFYIVNGDKENTLCRSNEELHILLLQQQVPHFYNVKAGGHEFSFWRDCLPEALNFANVGFNKQVYRPNFSAIKVSDKLSTQVASTNLTVSDKQIRVIYPELQNTVNRSYPIIYFVANMSVYEQNQLINLYVKEQEKNSLPPIIFCFVPTNYQHAIRSEIIPYMEQNGKARKGGRFRAFWAFGNENNVLLNEILEPDIFTVVALTSTTLGLPENEIKTILLSRKNARKQLWFYIDTRPESTGYWSNAFLHIQLREADFTHEYRVRSEQNDFNLLKSGFIETLNYINKKIHH